RRGRRGVGGVALLAPLPDVAQHVEQPQVVRLEPAHRPGPVGRIQLVPGVVLERILGGAVIAAGDRAGPAGVLPLRFRRQAVARPPQVIRGQLQPFAGLDGRLDVLDRRVAHLVFGDAFGLAEPAAVHGRVIPGYRDYRPAR